MKQQIKKSCFLLLFCLTPAFANECLDHINQHIYNNETQLYLSACNIQDEDMPKIAMFLANKPTIQEVFLDENNISSVGAAALENNQTITYLEIENNHIGDTGAVSLAKMSNPNLDFIDIDNNNVGDEGVIAITRNPHIEQLYVNNNHVGILGAKALSASSIFFLSIDKNTLDNNALAALSNSQKLRFLSIRDNNISPEGAAILVKNMPALANLDISLNPIGDEGIRSIAKKYKIEMLAAVNCAIGPEGAKAIAHLPLLAQVGLAYNHIQDEGAEALSKTFIYAANLSANWISDSGAMALANSKNLSLLELDRNIIHNEGAIALSKAPLLKGLDVRFNHIGTLGIAALKDRFLRNVDTKGNYQRDLMNLTSGVLQTQAAVTKSCKKEDGNSCFDRNKNSLPINSKL